MTVRRVLVVTNSEDVHAGLVVDWLKQANTLVLRLDTDRVGRDIALSVCANDRHWTGEVRDADLSMITDEIDAVWWRRPEPVQSPEALEETAAQFASAEWSALLNGLTRTVNGFWISDPEAIRRAQHKALQLHLARQMGFTIPPTCISNDPELIRQFAAAYGSRVIAKLVSPGPPIADERSDQYMIYTQAITADDLSADAPIRAAPAIYQAYIEKAYELRVTLVGSEVFACAIYSQETEQTKLDWRRYDLNNTPHREVQLSRALIARLQRLRESLGLQFGAVDLVVTPSGDIVFLEINPNGQWGWIEELTQMPISKAIADLLLHGRN